MVRVHRKYGPVRVTVSKTGFGYSAGGGPLRVTKRADGRVTRTVRIPGTGISDTRVVGARRSRGRNPSPRPALAGGPSPRITDGRVLLQVLAGICGVVALLLLVQGLIAGALALVVTAAFFIFCARIAGEQSTAEQTSPAPVWNVPPGWYHPPSGGRLLYWWDGQAWTEHTKPAPDPGQPRP